MHIGNIVTVGIDNQSFLHALRARGYTLFPVDSIASVLDISNTFDFMLVQEELLINIDYPTLEHVYFTNNSTPVALLLKNHQPASEMLLALLNEGYLEAIYDFEIKTGTIYQRIDRLIINARLNSNLHRMQEDFSKEEILKKELSFRKQVLSHEQEVNANIIASITTGLIVFDMNGTIILANEPAKQVLKNHNIDIIGSSYSSSLPQVISEEVGILLKEISNPDSRPNVKKCKINDSFFEIYCYRMLDYQDQPNGLLMLINDITEQENINVLLYRSERLATVGTMLSGIAHELRNPLAIISARIQRALSKDHYEEGWLTKSFNSIQTQTTRCASIVNNLLNFTRNTATSSGFHKISKILDETLTYVEYQNVFDNITVEKHYNNELLVFGDRSRFVQIFLNLITNAADAMEGRGILTIGTLQENPSFTLVEIHDNGAGIDEKIAEKIFDPFFTTKEPGKGTGLGLAIVYKIVQESNGKIWLNSKPGRTSFFVGLPSEKELSHDSAYSTR